MSPRALLYLLLLQVFLQPGITDLNQYIVTFTEYLSQLEQKQVIEQCLARYPAWFRVEGRIPTERSDFCVIGSGGGGKGVDGKEGTVLDERLKSELLGHDKVSGVYKDKILTVDLKSTSSRDEMYGGTERSSYLDFFQRKLMSVTSRSITSLVQAPVLWRRGITGKGVKVAILDTGLQANHPHFRHVMDAIDFTDDNDHSDQVIGHGTFVAGVIASSRDCLGIAPDSEIYSLKVFNSKQISHTSWFLEAFNYALQTDIDILNLSIGGPDFMDALFVKKVMELTSRGVIFVSALGNDGPHYGTLNNPADQLDVIGVGGLSYEDEVADFSSRGMTLWELPYGYGRVKPDIVTYGTAIRGSSLKGSCRYLTGTSVASPVASGMIALITQVMKDNERLQRVKSPASMKQILMTSAERVKGSNMFEQGSGKVNLIRAYELAKGYVPQITVSPDRIDWTDCPYMWPYCSQPVYHTAMPVIVNMTLINGMASTGEIRTPPTWHPKTDSSVLEVAFEYSSALFPWSGYVAVVISVGVTGKETVGTEEGYILVTVTSPPSSEDITEQTSTVKIPVKINVIPTPSRGKRILWDQFHSLGYPVGPFPRDNLNLQTSPLDWNGDHIHTNFNEMYNYLRSKGYFVEVLNQNFRCFDALNYGHLLLVDLEDEFFKEEIQKLEVDVNKHGLNVIVFADWYNYQIIKHIKFFDDNTKQWVIPQGGGANIPALNKLLSPWNIVLSDKVWKGKFTMTSHTMEVASASSLLSFPGDVFTTSLVDETAEILSSSTLTVGDVPILGVARTPVNGSIAVYTDSSCLDSVGHTVKCFWLLEDILRGFTTGKELTVPLQPFKQPKFRYPKVASTALFHRYSRVVKASTGGQPSYRDIPVCRAHNPVPKQAYNNSYPIGQLHSRLLSINHKLDSEMGGGGGVGGAGARDMLSDYNYEADVRVFYILGIITAVSIVVVLYFLYSVYSLFHKKRIVLYKVRTRRGV